MKNYAGITSQADLGSKAILSSVVVAFPNIVISGKKAAESLKVCPLYLLPSEYKGIITNRSPL
jgi:hypothetical protein